MRYIFFQFPDIENVGCAFTLRKNREDGAGNLSTNALESPELVARKQDFLQQELGFETWLDVKQCHGTQMAFYPDQFDQNLEKPEADALATGTSRQGLVIKVADCQPVLLAHYSGKYIAALHVGWRANRANALLGWVERFCRYYAIEAKDILAVRGPSLGPQKSEFINFQQEWGEPFIPYFNSRNNTVNLWELTTEQLQQSGIPREQIFNLDFCTYSMQEMFYSYRREKTLNRQAGIIWKS